MTLENIIQAVVNRDGNGGGESLIVANHLAQLKLFGARGIELYPVQDPTGERKKFISSIWKYNRMDLYLDYIWDLYLTCGEILFYLRPTGDSYEISWFHGGTTDPNPEYKAYYKPGGRELERVVIAYPYKRLSLLGTEEERWVKLEITKETIRQHDLTQKPNLNGITGDIDLQDPNVQTVENTLGFIPCVAIPNHPSRPGQPGSSEFHWLRQPIERHDKMLTTINRNLSLFANPTLVTTRSRSEVLEAAAVSGFVPTVASQSGYYPSTNRSDPRERSQFDGGEKVASVIGGIGPDERVGYIQVDPVSGDQNLYQREYREQLHTALGGVDPLGIRSGATAYEIKVRSGSTAATARKKCLALYDYGLCKLFEMILLAEENLFKQSLFAVAIEQEKEFKGLLADIYKQQGAKLKPKDIQLESPNDITDDICQMLLEFGVIPRGVIGMPPMGDRVIEWRFTSEIFPDTSREILDKSIVGRNLAEAGINTEYVLRFLFPDKTDKEIAAMQSGNFSYRTTQNKVQAINQLIGLYQNFLSLPDPLDPAMPLGWRLDITPLIEKALSLVAQEFSYGETYDEPDKLNSPTTTNGNGSNSYNDVTTNGSSPPSDTNPGIYTPRDERGSTAAAGLPTQFPGVGTSYQPPVGYRSRADWGNPLPTPGGTVTNSVPRLPTGQQPSNFYPPGLPADIAVSPELWGIFAQQQQTGNSQRSRGKR
ncbi:hypothetical protein Ava_D0012 [Trichormus variabilis ATCC 29413]|uniref:Uncharacterized protein n=2 Tax=Anabaena variabilis TaxID=264691 RepID=Q3M2V9_TRIV2|nr:hypothetical protein [Trichormus variabilis]ABA24677.1 hypothetical protein Ava_D0012 [Trichormus variabilis ATCC 29413]MBC1217712.1 hypothetical protein [Trichormus variabilis ARAD]MBC1258997.1 hypothetical protein [Trichormus variabilis V5]MBC1302708.1 hypothetical protein [Trichormus variabilis N2B]MBC1324563.1 hypothetical protein [Trichormus variabilis 9RC]